MDLSLHLHSTDIAEAASAPHLGQEGPIYPGTCAGRSPSDSAALSVPFAWRFRTRDRALAIHDQFAGHVTCNPARELGDFVIGKKDGTPAYQLAVVVDDQDMGVTEVCRGDDLLPSAFRQTEIYDALGWKPPSFMHVPLVIGPDGRRLAKRHGDTRISLLREKGSRQSDSWDCWPGHVAGNLTAARHRSPSCGSDLT